MAFYNIVVLRILTFNVALFQYEGMWNANLWSQVAQSGASLRLPFLLLSHLIFKDELPNALRKVKEDRRKAAKGVLWCRQC